MTNLEKEPKSDLDKASNYHNAGLHLMQIGEGCVWGMKSVFRAFENAADLGHTYAKVQLARLLWSKQDSRARSEQVAREVRLVVQESADGGDSDAQWCLGILYWMEKEIANAFFWFKKSADQGNMYAQFELGSCYWFGDGTDENHRLAAEEWTKAADRGHIDAQFNLSSLYRDGDGVTKDISKAFQLCKKAALQHHFLAQIAIVCYYTSNEIEQYEETCTQILNLENDKVQFEVADTLFKSDKFDLAVKWYTRAADNGNVQAQFHLAMCYEHNKGVERDLVRAAKWFTKAAEKEHAEAQFHLGRFFYNGTGVTQSYEKAVNWYSKVAEQGHPIAQHNLGYCFEHGEGVDKNMRKAIDLYFRSAAQGYPESQLRLGFCYQHGIVVPENLSKAVEWYNKAAEQGSEEARKRLRDFDRE